jgi:hypothetical protein
MGVGARSHCDVVVKVDAARERILAIGGNVRGTVSLKLIAASAGAGKLLRPVGAGDETRPFFAHLKLRAAPVDPNALDASPTLKTFGCEAAVRAPAVMTATGAPAAGAGDRC